MWTVIYVSQSADTAKKLREALQTSGIISKQRGKCGSDETTGCYEVLVPGTEMEAARDIIIENGLF